MFFDEHLKVLSSKILQESDKFLFLEKNSGKKHFLLFFFAVNSIRTERIAMENFRETGSDTISKLAEKIWRLLSSDQKNNFDKEIASIFNPYTFNSLGKSEIERKIKVFSKDTQQLLLLNLLFSFFSETMKLANEERDIPINDPKEVYRLFYDLKFEPNEVLKALYLDSNFNLKKTIDLAIGSSNRALISPGDIFFHAAKVRSENLILLHNHPSGPPTPSVEDLAFTRKVQNSCNLVGIHFVDHVIIGDGFYSFRQNGFLEESQQAEKENILSN